MAKLVLPTVTSGFLSAELVNAAFRAVEEWADTVLSRDGQAPNQMQADIDLNGYTLLNLDGGGEGNGLVSYQDMVDYVDQRASGLILQDIEIFTATASQTVFTLTSFTYTPDVGNLAVYRNGLRQFAGLNYTETNSSTITFLTPMALNDKIEVVSNEFVATVSLPPHMHPWGQVTGVPVYTTRWPTWDEVSGKPATFYPSGHQHNTADIQGGTSFSDPYRGVFVQFNQPSATRIGDLWII